MIDVRSEQLISMRDAPKHVPLRPNGKRLHMSACYRWITKGVQGVLLESIRIGGTTYTSMEAIQRFADRLTRPGREPSVGNPASLRRAKPAATALALERELGLAHGSLGPRPPSP